MFRNFDNHDVYFDLNGKPLHGCDCEKRGRERP